MRSRELPGRAALQSQRRERCLGRPADRSLAQQVDACTAAEMHECPLSP